MRDKLIKIALINPPSPDKRKIIRLIDCGHETKGNYLWQPSDFMIITSLLKPEDDAILIDGTADSLNENEFLREIEDLNDIDILFFAFAGACWNSDYSYFKKIREVLPECPIYVFGDIFLEKEYQEIILKECNGIIYQPFLLELEKMADIKNNVYEKLAGISLNPENDVLKDKKHYKVDNISSLPRHEIFIQPGYRFPFARHFKFSTVTVTWGCPFNCSYCPDSKFSTFSRNYENVLEELEYLKKLNIKELFFADKTFGFPQETVIPLLREMINKKFGFSWSCYHNPQLYTSELLELMANAGCHTIIIGIDSVNYESLSQYNRNLTKEKAEELIAHANKLNINVCADFILGLEHESEQDICKTIDYALKLPLDFVSFNIAAPTPGSSIRENAIKEGKLTNSVEGFDSLGNKQILGNNYVTSKRLLELKRKALIRFYLKPSYLLRRIKKTTSIEHFLIQLNEMISIFKKA